MGVAIAAGLLITAVVAFIVGLLCGLATETKNKLRDLGFTKESARLYSRAAKIFNRMVKVTELDGDFAADLLSGETTKQVNDWLADYRKQVEKI